MEQTRTSKRLKKIRLHSFIHPIHQKWIAEELKQARKQGRDLTKAEIIRESLDARYLSKRGKSVE